VVALGVTAALFAAVIARDDADPTVGVSSDAVDAEGGAAGGEARIEPSPDELARLYVSLGDSFASGEGLEPFEDGTDEPGVDECHRSPRAYPVILAGVLDLEMTARACTRATTVNLLDEDGGLWGHQRQLAWLSEATELVTITIGGNDLGDGDDGLGSVIRRCLLWDCAEYFTSGGTDVISRRIDALRPRLLDVYRQAAALAPHAEIYVLGYPHLFPHPSGPARSGSSNPVAVGGDSGCQILFDADERAWLRERLDELNAAIRETAERVDRVTYVDIVDDPTYGFAGHELCTEDPWIRSPVLSLLDWEHSLHPTAAGHQAIAALLSRRVEPAPVGAANNG
jgi:lysophospholipase L1-like esterase